eukprot:scaffold74394_cov57-Phaeocystis_antarctica.AAC.3
MRRAHAPSTYRARAGGGEVSHGIVHDSTSKTHGRSALHRGDARTKLRGASQPSCQMSVPIRASSLAVRLCLGDRFRVE